jgi:hypothetical protein
MHWSFRAPAAAPHVTTTMSNEHSPGHSIGAHLQWLASSLESVLVTSFRQLVGSHRACFLAKVNLSLCLAIPTCRRHGPARIFNGLRLA